MHHKSQAFLPSVLVAVMLSVVTILGPLACSSGSQGAGQARALSVSAATGLKTAFVDIAAAFDAANDTNTSLNFEPAGTLQTQIEAGADVDVFASAATKQMDALLDQKLVDESSVKVFASNEIVVVVPTDSALSLASFQDLTLPVVERVSYGDPAVTAHGAAAEEILDTLNIYDQVKPKVIYAANVAQSLEYVKRGEVDAGIVFSTEAKTAEDSVRIVAHSEPDWQTPIAFPIAIVSSSSNKAMAQAFIDFVCGDAGQAILQQHGFLPTPTE